MWIIVENEIMHKQIIRKRDKKFEKQYKQRDRDLKQVLVAAYYSNFVNIQLINCKTDNKIYDQVIKPILNIYNIGQIKGSQVSFLFIFSILMIIRRRTYNTS
jgi:polyferredoxin